MNDLPDTVVKLGARLETLERRVYALEHPLATAVQPHAQTPCAATSVPGDTEIHLPRAGGVFSVLGKAMLGIAGAYLSIAANANFSREMTAGQGYIALAALIFGKWKPLGAFGACLLFGLLETAAIRLQGTAIAGFAVPVQLIQALPYILTVTLLAGFIGRATAPKAIGQPYEKAH